MEYICAGFSGHGMPVAFLAGKDIANMILCPSDSYENKVDISTGINNEDPMISTSSRGDLSVKLPDAYLPKRFGL